MKTDFVRQEDEEAKENEPRFRDVKKQEAELGRCRQRATARYGQCETGGYQGGVRSVQVLRDVTLSPRRFELSRCLRPIEYTDFVSISFIHFGSQLHQRQIR